MSNALTTTKQSDQELKICDAALIQILRYDCVTGEFYWSVNRRGGAKAGDLAGTVKTGGYIQINACAKLYYAHRLAWRFMHGSWPAGHIDHIDGNPSNNRIENLRDVSVLMNQQNQRRAHVSNKSSGFQGVSFDARTNRWMAKISINNTTKNLGRYDTPEQDHSAYLSAKRINHEGCTI